MNQAGNGRMAVFTTRIGHFPGRGGRFLDAGNHLAPNRAVLICGIDQIEKIGRDGQSQLCVGELGSGVFLGRQGWHEALELGQGSDPVLQLPLPIIPVPVRNVGPKAFIGRVKFFEFAYYVRVGSSFALIH